MKNELCHDYLSAKFLSSVTLGILLILTLHAPCHQLFILPSPSFLNSHLSSIEGRSKAALEPLLSPLF